MAPAVRERCREVAALAARDDGLEVAADCVERLSASRAGVPSGLGVADTPAAGKPL
jgi:hypothetical protein